MTARAAATPSASLETSGRTIIGAGPRVIVCLRTVAVPAAVRDRYLAWIEDGRKVRQAHGIVAVLVCEPSSGECETVVVTVCGYLNHVGLDQAGLPPEEHP